MLPQITCLFCRKFCFSAPSLKGNFSSVLWIWKKWGGTKTYAGNKKSRYLRYQTLFEIWKVTLFPDSTSSSFFFNENIKYVLITLLRFGKRTLILKNLFTWFILEINDAKLSTSTETEVKKSKKGSLNGNIKCLRISKLKNIQQNFLDFLFSVWNRITYVIKNWNF